MLKINLLLALSTTLLVVLLSVATSFSWAKIPANVPCLCANGATRDTAITDHCVCTGCPAPFVLPFCTFKGTERVRIAITYRNQTGFALDSAQKALQTRFAVGGDDIKWIQRLPRFEADITEVAVQYLITGSFVNQIYTDIYTTPLPAYLTNPKALDLWQLGTVVATPGVFSRHYAKGNALSEFQIMGDKADLSSAQLEFFIGGLSVLLFCPLMEAIFYWTLHPKDLKHPDDDDNNGGNLDDREMEQPPANSTPSPHAQIHGYDHNANQTDPTVEANSLPAYPSAADYVNPLQHQERDPHEYQQNQQTDAFSPEKFHSEYNNMHTQQHQDPGAVASPAPGLPVLEQDGGY